MSEEEKDKENKIDQEDSGSDQDNQPEDVDKKPDNKDQLQSGSESYMSVDEITSVSKNETNESSKTPETKENETTPSSNITETSEIKDNKEEEKKEHEVIHKKDGRLHIYIRQDKYKGELKSKNWVGRLYIDGKQKISSSGTPNLDDAIPILEKWFDDVHANKDKEKSKETITPEETQNTPETGTTSATPPTAEGTTPPPSTVTEAPKPVTSPIETKNITSQDINANTINENQSTENKKSISGLFDKLKNIKSLNRDVESLYSKFLMGLQYILKQSGPITMGASQVCAFTKSDPSRATPNLQFHVQPLSTDILGVTPMHNFEGITPTVANIRPTSRGEINITSNDSRDNPKIKMNYLSTEDDRIVAAKSLKLVRKIMLETETFKKYQPEEYRPGVHITDDEELVKAGSDFTQTIFHPVGTCKMGNDDSAVVNDKLSVHGIRNLRVIDASIMPNITSGNTNAPTIMIAEKGADMILNS